MFSVSLNVEKKLTFFIKDFWVFFLLLFFCLFPRTDYSHQLPESMDRLSPEPLLELKCLQSWSVARRLASFELPGGERRMQEWKRSRNDRLSVSVSSPLVLPLLLALSGAFVASIWQASSLLSLLLSLRLQLEKNWWACEADIWRCCCIMRLMEIAVSANDSKSLVLLFL